MNINALWKKLSVHFSSRTFLLISSFLMALGLWFYVVGNRNEEIAKTYEIRLEFLNPPAELALFPSVRTVVVTLNGERRAMNALEPEAMVSEVDLKGLGPGRHSVPIHFRAPARMTVAQIVPKDIEVELARMMDKPLAVRVLPPENMPSGYVMDAAGSSPTTVMAHGREDQLSTITEVTVRPTVDELFRGGVWKIPLRAPAGVELDFSPPDVNVSATYFQGLPRKELPVKVKTRGVLSPNLRLISLKTVPETVTVEGRTDAFNNVENLYTQPLNLARVKESGSQQLKISALPRGLSLLSSPIVTANIEVKTTSFSRDFENVTPEIRGTAAGGRWSVEPAGVTVYVEGTASALKNLKLADLGLKVFVDVSYIVTDSVRLPVRLEYHDIAGIENVGVEPSTVRVNKLP